MTNADAAEQLAQRVIDGAMMSVLKYLWDTGKPGTVEEMDDLKGCLKSAILSKLESYTNTVKV